MKELKIIRRIVEMVTGLDIWSKRKTTEYVNARMIYYAISKKLTKATLGKIGKEVNRDHATVINGLKFFERDILKDKLNSEMYKTAYKLSKSEINTEGITMDQIDKMHELITTNNDLRLELSIEKLKGIQGITEADEKELINLFRDLDQDTKERALFLVNNLYKVNQKLSA